MWSRAEEGAERLERGHSRENTGVVGPRERRGQPGVTGFFFLQVLFAWTERKTAEDRAGQSEQRVCLCASEGGAAGGFCERGSHGHVWANRNQGGSYPLSGCNLQAIVN